MGTAGKRHAHPSHFAALSFPGLKKVPIRCSECSRALDKKEYLVIIRDNFC